MGTSRARFSVAYWPKLNEVYVPCRAYMHVYKPSMPPWGITADYSCEATHAIVATEKIIVDKEALNAEIGVGKNPPYWTTGEFMMHSIEKDF